MLVGLFDFKIMVENKVVYCFSFLLFFTFYSTVSAQMSLNKKGEVFYSTDSIVISRLTYRSKLQGFWLGQCIANWTALITEMDKVGNVGDVKSGKFYTSADWGSADLPNIWGELKGEVSNGEQEVKINFVLKKPSLVWGSDDDTDIEYMYQELLFHEKKAILDPLEIKDGWLKHIKKEEENYLWVSNQKAFDLMRKGILPPETSDPRLNPYFDMIDAQLTTEIFGLYAPTRPFFAKRMAYLPIRTVARKEAVMIAEFYVTMHALASSVREDLPIDKQITALAAQARENLPDDTYPAMMYDFVWKKFQSGISWEATRDSIYNRYQVNQQDGYDITSRKLHCNGCFAAGINFAAGLVSLFYGKGDIKETVKIGTLTGWDADNPTATWGGLLGFMMGIEEVEKAFGEKLSHQYHIHRTRIHFANEGLDDFESMSEKGISIVNLVVLNHLGGRIDEKHDNWIIPRQINRVVGVSN